METLIFLVVLGTTIWVGYDASTNKITSSDGPYSLMNGALGWVLVCVLLWIVAFPAYLVRRGKVMAKRGVSSPAVGRVASASLSAELEKLSALRAANHISESEYQQAKGKLLS